MPPFSILPTMDSQGIFPFALHYPHSIWHTALLLPQQISQATVKSHETSEVPIKNTLAPVTPERIHLLDICFQEKGVYEPQYCEASAMTCMPMLTQVPSGWNSEGVAPSLGNLLQMADFPHHRIKGPAPPMLLAMNPKWKCQKKDTKEQNLKSFLGSLDLDGKRKWFPNEKHEVYVAANSPSNEVWSPARLGQWLCLGDFAVLFESTNMCKRVLIFRRLRKNG